MTIRTFVVAATAAATIASAPAGAVSWVFTSGPFSGMPNGHIATTSFGSNNYVGMNYVLYGDAKTSNAPGMLPAGFPGGANYFVTDTAMFGGSGFGALTKKSSGWISDVMVFVGGNANTTDNVVFDELGDTMLSLSSGTMGQSGQSGWLTFTFASSEIFGGFGFGVSGGNEASLALIAEPGSYDNAVPEPASWAMMIAGFGLVGGAMRVRARRATFAVS